MNMPFWASALGLMNCLLLWVLLLRRGGAVTPSLERVVLQIEKLHERTERIVRNEIARNRDELGSASRLAREERRDQNIRRCALSPDGTDRRLAKRAARYFFKSTVEYAIKLPGRDTNGKPIWLPIDAKFPQEDYQRLEIVLIARAARGASSQWQRPCFAIFDTLETPTLRYAGPSAPNPSTSHCFSWRARRCRAGGMQPLVGIIGISFTE